MYKVQQSLRHIQMYILAHTVRMYKNVDFVINVTSSSRRYQAGQNERRTLRPSKYVIPTYCTVIGYTQHAVHCTVNRYCLQSSLFKGNAYY